MKEILLNGATWKNPEDFYAAFLQAIGAPDWHGHNLDALNDSIRGGDLNQVNPPFTVRIHGSTMMSADAKQTLDRFKGLIENLKHRGVEVDIHLES